MFHIIKYEKISGEINPDVNALHGMAMISENHCLFGSWVM